MEIQASASPYFGVSGERDVRRARPLTKELVDQLLALRPQVRSDLSKHRAQGSYPEVLVGGNRDVVFAAL